jgi:hypothetical protein
MTARRIVLTMVVPLIIVLAVGVAAVKWVSVPLTDQQFSCGTSLSEWRDGAKFPYLLYANPRGWGQGGLARSTTPINGPIVTLCQGQARRRMAESGGAIAFVALGVVTFWRRRLGATPASAVRPLMHPQWPTA